MIIEVKDINYKGFHIQRHDKDGATGWKIILGEDEYLFPVLTDAKAAVEEFLGDVIKKHKGKKLK